MIGQAAMDGPALRALLDAERARVDEALAIVARELDGVVPPALREAASYALSTHGKRLRPILCLAAHRATGGVCSGAMYRLSCSLEIIHTYSLVHDDLPCMDNDDVRRGRPTVHRVHGTPVATLAGAALLPLAIHVLDEGAAEMGLDPTVRRALIVELCRAAGANGMVGGQLRDLEGESAPVDRDRLESIHRAKTGALLSASLRVGGLAAGASTRALDALTGYGDSLGLAFQITDDILDVIGDATALGKAAGRDESMRKASYPALFGLDGARALARARAEEAKNALGDLRSAELLALADFVVERQR